MGLDATKPVFGVSDKASFKPVSSATVTSYKIEISPAASLYMVLSKKRITKALIRLRGCAGWSAPVLFANTRKQVFSCRGPHHAITDKSKQRPPHTGLDVTNLSLGFRLSKTQISLLSYIDQLEY